VHAEKIAKDLTNTTGEQYIVSVEHGHYRIVKAPKVGDKVSYSFNGDTYPCGTIVSISKTAKKIVTSDGSIFWRYKNMASWLKDGTWYMVKGWINERNESF
jgi:hypothetical protein